MSEDREETYDPSSVEIDRGRQQGLGMGARDLQGQRDPGDGLGAEELAPEDAKSESPEAEDEPDLTGPRSLRP